MKPRLKLIKAEKREEKRQKARKAPKGGTLAGQIKKLETVRKYSGKKVK